MISLRYTRNLILRSLCIVYLFAFLSFYIQIPGLYGDNGILPAKAVLENSKHKTLFAKVHYQPTLLWLAPYLGLDVNYALDVLALLGSFLAFTGFVSQKFCTIALFAGLWSLYFSLYQIGQVFVTSNFDELLLEVGFLAFFIAPVLPGRRKGLKGSPIDAIPLWLVKWLLVRYFLTSGLSKFLTGGPKWWSLTAFTQLFECNPLPTPLSWYLHQVPTWYLKMFAVITNVFEIGLPLLCFIPIRSVRITSFVFQLLFQVFSIVGGNNNVTNLLLITILLSLVDDQFFLFRRKPMTKLGFFERIATIAVFAALTLLVINLYQLKMIGHVIEANIGFTKPGFDYILKQGLPIVVYVAAVSLSLTVIHVFTTIFFTREPGFKLLSILSTVIYAGIAILLFFASTVPLVSLHSTTNSTVHPTIRTAYNRLHKLHVINHYAPLVKTALAERHEVILEASEHVEGPWLEYNFLYKPSNVNHSLPFVAPYSPRLDWQLYWASESTYEKQPWILSLAHRLLQGRAEVLNLLDKHHSNHIPVQPKYIRGVLYKYKFSSWSQRSQPSWWVRERIGEYFPPYSKNSPALIEYLNARNLLPTPSKHTVNPILKQVLDTIRYIAGHLEATLLLWSVFTAGCAIITTSAKK